MKPISLPAMLLLLLILSARGLSQPSVPDSPRYLIPLVEKSGSDTNRISLLLRLGGYYIFKAGEYRQDLDSAMECLNSALELSQELHNNHWTNEALKLKGDCYLEGNDLRNGGECFQRVADFFHRRNESLEEEKVWERWGDCIEDQHNTEKLDCFLHASTLVPPFADTIRFVLYRKIGTAYFFKHDYNTGKSYFQKAIDYYDKIKNKSAESYVFWYMAYFLPIPLYAEKEKYLARAISLLQEVPGHDNYLEMLARHQLAETHFRLGKLDLAEKELKQMLSEYKVTEKKELHLIYELLGDVYDIQGYPDKAIANFLECLTNVRSSDTSLADYYYNRIGACYQKFGYDDRAISFYVRELDQPVGNMFDSVQYFVALNGRNDILVKNGRVKEAIYDLQQATRNGWPKNPRIDRYLDQSFGTYYKAQKQYVLAEKYYSAFTEVMEKNKAIESFTDYAYSYFLLGDLYTEMRQYAKAAACLKKIGEIPFGIFSATDLSRFYLLHYKVDSVFGNYAAALQDRNRYSELNDSIFNAIKVKQLQELEVSYETRQKEQSITDLQNKDKVRQAELTKANAQKRLILVGSGLLLVIAVLAFIGFRQKQRSNRLLKVHQKEIDEKNLSLESLNHRQALLLTEKEWLIREIHHRVKNNLQTTISLLHMQSAYLTNEHALTAIRNSQHRLQAMSLIHQRLYQSEDMTSVEMSSYVTELVSFLRESYSGIDNIFFDSLIEPVVFDISLAIPMGLIINEAITNAIKYAFPGNRIGRISISLQACPGGNYILVIRDNGVGFSVSGRPSRSQGSLGLDLIRGLTDQLQGDVKIESQDGTTITIIFNAASIFVTEPMAKAALI
jgi:two-component system, sensor histidine kinase PdtaS